MQIKKPMVLVIAGPNGSGKSTITNYFNIVGEYTNADDMVAATDISNKDAAVLADLKRYSCIEEKRDFTFETVLSSEYKIRLLQYAKEKGYFIKCVFVLTNSPKVNVDRVEARVANGGHNVEKTKITSRYYKSLRNVKKLLEICDIVHVYDNTEKPLRIIRKHKDSLTIYPMKYWSEEQIMNLINGEI